MQNETPKMSDSHFMAILKMVPNVEELILFNVYICSEIGRLRPRKEMDLHKLKKLELNYCVFDNALFLDLIPADILSDLVFTFDSHDETIYQNFFNRQAKIKKLKIFENDLINFDHLELEYLKISSDVDFVAMLDRQKKLKYVDFAITWIDDKVFDAVLQLKELEVLCTLIDQVPCDIFKRLIELKHLKELKIDSHSSFHCEHLSTLSMMKNMKLEKLTLYFATYAIPKEILIQISQNFLQLKHIQLVNRSIQILVTIVKCFPNMESILMDFSAIFYTPHILEMNDKGMRHENLKQIVITDINTSDVQNTQPLLTLCNSCPNLERIMLSKLTGMSLIDFEELLTKHQKLTHLSLEVDDFKFDFVDIVIVARLISNLHHFRMSELTSYPMYSKLQCLLKDIFAIITLNKFKTGKAELIMKRRTADDWYSKFNIVFNIKFCWFSRYIFVMKNKVLLYEDVMCLSYKICRLDHNSRY